MDLTTCEEVVNESYDKGKIISKTVQTFDEQLYVERQHDSINQLLPVRGQLPQPEFWVEEQPGYDLELTAM